MDFNHNSNSSHNSNGFKALQLVLMQHDWRSPSATSKMNLSLLTLLSMRVSSHHPQMKCKTSHKSCIRAIPVSNELFHYSYHVHGCAANTPQPDDLIQSAMYSQEAEAGHNNHMGRGRPEHALPEGRGNQAMDIDSAAAHRIPRGKPPMAHSCVCYPVITATTGCCSLG